MRSMVGLSVILENCKDLSAKRSPQVVSKGSMIKPPSNPSSPTTLSSANGFSFSSNISCFLERCCLCQQKLLPGKDIYMYKGEWGFCSVECRCRQIFMDEEETAGAAKGGCTREYNRSLASKSSPSSSRGGKSAARNRVMNNNAFAY